MFYQNIVILIKFMMILIRIKILKDIKLNIDKFY
jgi:hypothetical protein